MKQAAKNIASLNGIFDSETIEMISSGYFEDIPDTIDTLLCNAFTYGMEDSDDVVRWNIDKRLAIVNLANRTKSIIGIINKGRVGNAGVCVSNDDIMELERLMGEMCNSDEIYTHLPLLDDVLMVSMYNAPMYQGVQPNKQVCDRLYFECKLIKMMYIGYILTNKAA